MNWWKWSVKTAENMAQNAIRCTPAACQSQSPIHDLWSLCGNEETETNQLIWKVASHCSTAAMRCRTIYEPIIGMNVHFSSYLCGTQSLILKALRFSSQFGEQWNFTLQWIKLLIPPWSPPKGFNDYRDAFVSFKRVELALPVAKIEWRVEFWTGERKFRE